MKDKNSNKDVLYVVDFIVNIIVVALVALKIKSIYLTASPDDFMNKVIFSGGVFVIIAFASALCAAIELIYWIRRKKNTDAMVTIMQWPVMWAVFKVIMLIVWIITTLCGINLFSNF